MRRLSAFCAGVATVIVAQDFGLVPPMTAAEIGERWIVVALLLFNLYLAAAPERNQR